MTMPSPWHVMSFASMKLSLTRIAQRPSREAIVVAGAGVALPIGDPVAPATGLAAGEMEGAGDEAAWQATRKPVRTRTSRAGAGGRRPSLCRIVVRLYTRRQGRGPAASQDARRSGQ